MYLDINWQEESVAEAERRWLKELLEQGIAKVLSLAEAPEEAEISLTLATDAEIQELNRAYRGVDRPTDVLSFALQEETEEEPGILNHEDHLLGDIVISVERARAQAAAYGHAFERELVYLAVHGTLHLLGYDHQEAGDQEKMRRQEEAVMGQIGLGR